MSRRCGCLFPFSLLLISFTDYSLSFFFLPAIVLLVPPRSRSDRIELRLDALVFNCPFSVRIWPSSHLPPTHLHTQLQGCWCKHPPRSCRSWCLVHVRQAPGARLRQGLRRRLGLNSSPFSTLLYYPPFAFVYQPSLMLLCPSYPSGFRFVLPRRKEQSSCFTPPSGLSPRELERDCTHASQIAVCKCSAANAHSALAEAKLSRGRIWRSPGFQDTCALRHLQ